MSFIPTAFIPTALIPTSCFTKALSLRLAGASLLTLAALSATPAHAAIISGSITGNWDRSVSVRQCWLPSLKTLRFNLIPPGLRLFPWE